VPAVGSGWITGQCAGEGGYRPTDYRCSEVGRIPAQRLLLDALTTTLAANPAAAADVLETLRLYGSELGLPVSMGLSNVSHGLPRRICECAVFRMAAAQGLNIPILNPMDPMMNDAMSAVQALLGHDRQGLEYSRRFAAQGPQKPAAATGAQDGGPSPVEQLRQAVIQGERKRSKGSLWRR